MELRQQIDSLAETLTPAERKLAAALLSDYPFAGLQTIQTLAEQTGVSAPSITRFVTKLGCHGYQDFQRRLIGELKEGHRSPVDLHERMTSGGADFLQSFLDLTAEAVRAVGESLTQSQFERICDLLADDKRAIYIVGGRISDAIAQHFSRHLRQVRRNVFHLPPDTEIWPEYILRMRARDLLIIFDFRRYQQRLVELADKVRRSAGTSVILVTDKWMSPAAAYAAEVIALPTENRTAWDSYAGALAVVDAMVASISERDWDATRDRIKAWDAVRFERSDKSGDA